MSIYTIYNSTTGQLLRKISTQDADLANTQVQAGESIINQDLSFDTQYISSGSPTTRPTLSLTWNKTTITANGSDSAIVSSSIPNPTNYSIIVPAGIQPITDGTITTGTLTFTADLPGIYTIILDSFPYQIYKQNITAT
jgi:hypothetical protein